MSGSGAKKEGLVFNIERYAVFDGPGIRTIVFFKGCPLSCLWCQNPEGQKPEIELAFFQDNCTGCMRCAEACPYGAVMAENGHSATNWGKCRASLKCVDVCTAEARKQIGEVKTAEQVVDEVVKDEAFYRRSGGGITLSGGEPLMQPDFAAEILRFCKSKNLHTAIETSGYSRYDDLIKVMEYTDAVYYDVKHMDSEKHKEGIGVGNEIILDNLDKIPNSKAVVVRIPVVPEYNDSEPTMREIVTFVKKLGTVQRIELLPYNQLGIMKYERIGRDYLLSGVKPPTREVVTGLKNLIISCGMPCEIV